MPYLRRSCRGGRAVVKGCRKKGLAMKNSLKVAYLICVLEDSGSCAACAGDGGYGYGVGARRRLCGLIKSKAWISGDLLFLRLCGLKLSG